MRVVATFMLLMMWPWWVFKSIMLSVVGMSLIVFREILNVWAGHPTRSQPARRKSP